MTEKTSNHAKEPETEKTGAVSPLPATAKKGAPVNPYAAALKEAAPKQAAEPEEGAMDAPPDDDEVAAQLAYENLTRHRKAKRRKRIIRGIIAALLVLAVAGGWIFAHFPKPGDDMPVLPSTMAYRGDLMSQVSSSGATVPLTQTVVTPEVDGIIQEVRVAEGQTVAQGDVLFTLKNDELDKAIREAENNVERAQRALNTAERERTNAYNAYDEAWVACNEIGDWSSFDEAGLVASINAADAGYDDAYLALEAAKEARDEAYANGEKRTVKAPAGGTIIAMNALSGAAVGGALGGSGQSASGSLVTIADLSKMKVTVQVNEIDISSIQVGQEGVATFSALPGVELACQVERIASTTGSGNEEMMYGGGVVSYAVDLIIPEPDPALKPGMTATVNITTQHVPDAIIVPVAALNDLGDGTWSVNVIVNEETQESEERIVEVIAQNSAEAAIKGDVADGDLVLMGYYGGEGEDMVADEVWVG